MTHREGRGGHRDGSIKVQIGRNCLGRGLRSVGWLGMKCATCGHERESI
jgi:hypothetical protein